MATKPKASTPASQASPTIAALPEADPLTTLKEEHLALQNEHNAAVKRIRELEAQAADPLSVVLGNLDAGVVLADAGKRLAELCGEVVKRDAAGTWMDRKFPRVNSGLSFAPTWRVGNYWVTQWNSGTGNVKIYPPGARGYACYPSSGEICRERIAELVSEPVLS